jgi:pre-mRNA-processing factor 17
LKWRFFRRQAGPENPFLTTQQKAPRNTLTGFVEPAIVSEFQFEMQRRTFAQLGYALDPSQTETGMKFVGNKDEVEKRNGEFIDIFHNIQPEMMSFDLLEFMKTLVID